MPADKYAALLKIIETKANAETMRAHFAKPKSRSGCRHPLPDETKASQPGPSTSKGALSKGTSVTASKDDGPTKTAYLYVNSRAKDGGEIPQTYTALVKHEFTRIDEVAGGLDKLADYYKSHVSGLVVSNKFKAAERWQPNLLLVAKRDQELRIELKKNVKKRIIMQSVLDALNKEHAGLEQELEALKFNDVPPD